MIFLVLTLTLFVSPVTAEEGSNQGTVPRADMVVPLPSAECVEKKKETSDILEKMEGGIMGTLATIISFLDVICKIKSAVMLVVSSIQFFLGCICAIPFMAPVCVENVLWGQTILEAFQPIEILCCFMTNGVCGLLVCGGDAEPSEDLAGDHEGAMGSLVEQTGGVIGAAATSAAGNEIAGRVEGTTQGPTPAATTATATASGSAAKKEEKGEIMQRVESLATSLDQKAVDTKADLGLTERVGKRNVATTKGKVANAFINPYDSIYIAGACMSPTGLLYNLQKLQQIYTVHECCVEQACNNGLSTSQCDAQFEEATCTFFEGSLVRVLIKGLISLIMDKFIKEFIIKHITENIFICVAAFIKVTQIPDMLEGMSNSFDKVGDPFAKPSCEEIGIDVQKKVQEEKDLETGDTSDIDAVGDFFSQQEMESRDGVVYETVTDAFAPLGKDNTAVMGDIQAKGIATSIGVSDPSSARVKGYYDKESRTAYYEVTTGGGFLSSSEKTWYSTRGISQKDAATLPGGRKFQEYKSDEVLMNDLLATRNGFQPDLSIEQNIGAYKTDEGTVIVRHTNKADLKIIEGKTQGTVTGNSYYYNEDEKKTIVFIGGGEHALSGKPSQAELNAYFNVAQGVDPENIRGHSYDTTTGRINLRVATKGSDGKTTIETKTHSNFDLNVVTIPKTLVDAGAQTRQEGELIHVVTASGEAFTAEQEGKVLILSGGGDHQSQVYVDGKRVFNDELVSKILKAQGAERTKLLGDVNFISGNGGDVDQIKFTEAGLSVGSSDTVGKSTLDAWIDAMGEEPGLSTGEIEFVIANTKPDSELHNRYKAYLTISKEAERSERASEETIYELTGGIPEDLKADYLQSITQKSLYDAKKTQAEVRLDNLRAAKKTFEEIDSERPAINPQLSQKAAEASISLLSTFSNLEEQNTYPDDMGTVAEAASAISDVHRAYSGITEIAAELVEVQAEYLVDPIGNYQSRIDALQSNLNQKREEYASAQDRYVNAISGSDTSAVNGILQDHGVQVNNAFALQQEEIGVVVALTTNNNKKINHASESAISPVNIDQQISDTDEERSAAEANSIRHGGEAEHAKELLKTSDSILNGVEAAKEKAARTQVTLRKLALDALREQLKNNNGIALGNDDTATVTSDGSILRGTRNEDGTFEPSSIILPPAEVEIDPITRDGNNEITALDFSRGDDKFVIDFTKGTSPDDKSTLDIITGTETFKLSFNDEGDVDAGSPAENARLMSFLANSDFTGVTGDDIQIRQGNERQIRQFYDAAVGTFETGNLNSKLGKMVRTKFESLPEIKYKSGNDGVSRPTVQLQNSAGANQDVEITGGVARISGNDDDYIALTQDGKLVHKIKTSDGKFDSSSIGIDDLSEDDVAQVESLTQRGLIKAGEEEGTYELTEKAKDLQLLLKQYNKVDAENAVKKAKAAADKKAQAEAAAKKAEEAKKAGEGNIVRDDLEKLKKQSANVIYSYLKNMVANKAADAVVSSMCEEEVDSSEPANNEPTNTESNNNPGIIDEPVLCQGGSNTVKSARIDARGGDAGTDCIFQYDLLACDSSLDYEVRFARGCEDGSCTADVGTPAASGSLEYGEDLLQEGVANCGSDINGICIFTTANDDGENFCVPFGLTVSDGGSQVDLSDANPQPIPDPKCADGQDNDGDGLIDLADTGCSGASDNSEIGACQDNRDNDNDGFIDLNDPGCENGADNDEFHVIHACDGSQDLVFSANVIRLLGDIPGLQTYTYQYEITECTEGADYGAYNIVMRGDSSLPIADGFISEREVISQSYTSRTESVLYTQFCVITVSAERCVGIN